MNAVNYFVEKGKGYVIRKIHTMQLIETNLLLLIKISLGPKSKESIESNNQLLKINNSARKTTLSKLKHFKKTYLLQ